MSVVLDVSHVGKSYATYRSNLQRFANWFGASIAPQSEFWANRDVSFQVKQGEAVALIGQNGAGKSTLLKMITGTVRPTVGSTTVTGRISAILELGLGFNPEFTGRQNIYQAGGLMGFSQQELTALMPGIEEFAEIGEFFDEPTRIYSSGMQARLAFALATAKRPDILIVDEVLSVGDSYFQHKSFDRIRQFKAQGASIILVTHGMGDVRALSDRVILLDKGTILKDGKPDEVVDYYNAMIAERENAKLSIEQKRSKDGWSYTEFGNDLAKVEAIDLYHPNDERPIKVARTSEELEVRARIVIKCDLDRLVIGHRITDRGGHLIWGSNTWHTKQIIDRPRAGQVLLSTLHFNCALGPGSYAVSFGLHRDDTHIAEVYHKVDNKIVFDVINTDYPFFMGTTHLNASFELDLVS
ncbi:MULTISPECIES: ABC transporter ATP-binding protein [unclassified Mesorhizobium]|uniref:ABC transporter ATP-binding protein n=1 Tax=unclassified Mesorhizobium TaxID=325217 RepID=UPI0024175DAF|nr:MULTISPECIES: ABC transporter ATP-binding protein [unclassified Mesorhizobium]MDG4900471.1 ABC transporter ATP-binding protein [Mesorhizobium sp. WSM4962]MDG4917293.1 ABC transporter ATP-binding protein [Mesorhizobium sp. WSM4989]